MYCSSYLVLAEFQELGHRSRPLRLQRVESELIRANAVGCVVSDVEARRECKGREGRAGIGHLR